MRPLNLRPRILLLPALALIIAACSDGSSTTGPPSGQPCVNDFDCPSEDEVCSGGACLRQNDPNDGRTCRLSSDCTRTYERCIDGVCTVECREARDCDDGEDCVNSQCKRLGSTCTENTDCPGGQACVGGQCSAIVVPGDNGGGNNGGGNMTLGQYRDPCTSRMQCETGLCLGDPNTMLGFCTQTCTGPGSCPAPDGCLSIGGDMVCGPGQDGQGTDIGTPCPTGDPNVCSTGICLQAPSGFICSGPCVVNTDCPPGMQCLPAQTQQGVTTLCQPGQGSGAGFGAPCGAQQICASGLCLTSGTCSYCTARCDGGSGCPPGYQCQALPDGQGGTVPVCVTEQCGGTGGGGNGGAPGAGYNRPCRSPDDCQSGLCLIAGATGQGFCSMTCTQDSQCPAPHRCRTIQGATMACAPSGDDGGNGSTGGVIDNVGPACTVPETCDSRLCLTDAGGQQGYCTARCTYGGTPRCPDGFACAPLDGDHFCQKSGVGAIGAPCTGEIDCQSVLCIGSAEGAICTIECINGVSCPAGYGCSTAGDGTMVCLPNP